MSDETPDRDPFNTQIFQRSLDAFETIPPAEPSPRAVSEPTSEELLPDAHTIPMSLTRRERKTSLISEIIRGLEADWQEVAYPKDTFIVRQGEPADGLVLITEGDVVIVDAANQQIIDHDGAGSLIGEMSLLTGKACSADVVATSDVQARMIPREHYADACERFPRLELALGQVISCRLGSHDHDALCGKVIRGYEIQSCVNRGGMGVIYRANSPGGETVALKMLMHKFIDDQVMYHRFGQEAELLASLDHPNVIRLIDHFLEYRTRFLVLDFCNGCDLLALQKAHGSLDEIDVRAIVGQIAAGLGAAHQKEVLHRDLKPANILLDVDGGIRVTDFGLSRLRELDVPDDQVVGTPAFMAPEQFVGGQPSVSADWYAFACLMVQLLCGDTLFHGCDLNALYRAKSSSKPETLLRDALSNHAVSNELFNVLVDALHPDPNERKMDLAYLRTWAAPVSHLMKS